VRGNLTVIAWKDKQNTSILMNIRVHAAPSEGYFCDEHGNALKPAVVQDCNGHIGYMEKSDCMMNSSLIIRWA
jgi:hypothetical protein